MSKPPTLINRLSAWTAEDLRAREQHRQSRAVVRATHLAVGWRCPNCGSAQVVEYPVNPWQSEGHVWARCRVGERASDPLTCLLLSRIDLRCAQAERWVEWSHKRWAYEATVDQYQRQLDGYYGPMVVGRPTTPPPRWLHPEPPHLTTDALRRVLPVRLGEKRTMDHPLYALLNLPSGHVHCVLITDYTDETGTRYGELRIDQPEHDGLRSELHALLHDDEVDAAEVERFQIVAVAPYGHEPYCWVPVRSPATTPAPVMDALGEPDEDEERDEFSTFLEMVAPGITQAPQLISAAHVEILED